MQIRKLRYAPYVPGKVERHCAAFLTQSGQVIIINSIFDQHEGQSCPFFNSGDAAKIIKKIMSGKKSSTTVWPFPSVVVWEHTKYSEDLISMAKAGQLVNAAVIENIPESKEELQQVARSALNESPK